VGLRDLLTHSFGIPQPQKGNVQLVFSKSSHFKNTIHSAHLIGLLHDSCHRSFTAQETGNLFAFTLQVQLNLFDRTASEWSKFPADETFLRDKEDACREKVKRTTCGTQFTARYRRCTICAPQSCTAILWRDFATKRVYTRRILNKMWYRQRFSFSAAFLLTSDMLHFLDLLNFFFCRDMLLYFSYLQPLINITSCHSCHALLVLKLLSIYVEEIQRDATVCRYLFTAELLYMFRASIAPVIRST